MDIILGILLGIGVGLTSVTLGFGPTTWQYWFIAVPLAGILAALII